MIKSSKELKKGRWFSVLLSLFVVIFDQATKWSILAFLPMGTLVNVCPCVNLVLTFNTGTSFGLLASTTVIHYYLIIALTILCILFLICMFVRLRTIVEQVLCAFIIGGAIGNLLDRFFHGAVVDFIDLYYETWHWPAFNIADSFISTSAFLLIIYNLFSKER
jgi:signal peptidase II